MRPNNGLNVCGEKDLRLVTPPRYAYDSSKQRRSQGYNNTAGHLPLASDNDIDRIVVTEPSRGEALLEKTRQRGIFRGQFRIRTLLTATALSSVGFAFVRWTGVSYVFVLEVIGILFAIPMTIAFFFAPYFSIAFVALFPWRLPTNRRRMTIIGFLVPTVPVFLLAASSLLIANPPYREDILDSLLNYLLATLAFWIPQIASMWFVWRFMLRDDSRRKRSADPLQSVSGRNQDMASPATASPDAKEQETETP